MRFGGDKAKADAVYKGVEALTPDDIAEVVVFTAGRRENVVVADTLIFPNHQVCSLCCGLRTMLGPFCSSLENPLVHMRLYTCADYCTFFGTI